MDQGTKEWHEWRRKGIGGSDAPVIMGVSPYKTRFELWEEKTGKREPEEGNRYILDKGHEFEIKARSIYELTNGIEIPADLVVHPRFNYLRASLDGYNKALSKIAEIKFMGAEDHEDALRGRVPEKYIYQIMHQLSVSGADHCDFISYCEDFNGKKLAVARVKPNEGLIRDMLEKEHAFWDQVKNNIPPELVIKDYKKIRVKGKTKQARELIETHNEYLKIREVYTSKEKAFRKDLPPHKRMILEGIKIVDGVIHYPDKGVKVSGLPILGELWNKNCEKLPKIKGCNSNRARQSKNRWKENPSEDYWIEVMNKIKASSFCTGENTQGWKANFDFFIRPETHLKVLEGRYDDEGKVSNLADQLED